MSHWYPHTVGTNNDKWYWIVHPDLPGVYSYGESCEEDADWNTVSWWNGPFEDYDAAVKNMMFEQGNAGSYTGPANDPERNKLNSALVKQMTTTMKIKRW